MYNKNDDNIELTNLLLKFTTNHLIDDTILNLEMLEKRIKLYHNLIKNLEDKKPLFFQKKKLIEYNDKLEEYNNRINELYIEFYNETKLLEKLYK